MRTKEGFQKNVKVSNYLHMHAYIIIRLITFFLNHLVLQGHFDIVKKSSPVSYTVFPLIVFANFIHLGQKKIALK